MRKTVGDLIFPCLRAVAPNMTQNHIFSPKTAEIAREMKIAQLQRARSSRRVECLWEPACGFHLLFHV